MGGVVANNVAIVNLISAHFGISEDEFFIGSASDPKAGYASPYHLGDIAAIMRGEISSKRFWSNFTQRTGIIVSGDPWFDFFHPVLDKGTADVIKHLKNRGQRVVCGTNTLAPHYQRHSERGDYAVFGAVYASHIMGIIKPDPAFWTYILKKEKIRPGEAFFADDLEENVKAADKLGLKTHLFTGAEGLASAIDSDP